jgi:hypothetical protein
MVILCYILQHPVLEEWCYEQMALAASAFAFSWSKWNSDTQDKEKILFQGSETLSDEPLLEVKLSPFLSFFYFLFFFFLLVKF